MSIIYVDSVYRSRHSTTDVSKNGKPYFKTDEWNDYTFFGEEDGIKSYIKRSDSANYWKVKKTDGTRFKLSLLSQELLKSLSKNEQFAVFFTDEKNVFTKHDGVWVRISEESTFDREFFTMLFSYPLFDEYDGIYTEKSKLHKHREYVIFAKVEKTLELVGLELVGNFGSESSGSPPRMKTNNKFAPGVKNPNLKRQRQRQRTNWNTSIRKKRKINLSFSTGVGEGIIKVKVWNLLKNEI